ncbi:MAG: Na+/H+ antiporter subunit E [Blautia sp.]|nr:Na+/H+ antiporter subunit E [Blautia sp.]
MLLLFFAVWLIFNGQITTEILIFGVVISGLMFAFICKFMDYSIRREKILFMRSGYLLKYLVVLIIEIVKANIAVVRLILSSTEVCEPVMVTFKTTLRSKISRVILANSITLTPGTITVSLWEDELIVHCLDKSMAEGMDNSVFVEMLEKMERIGA